MWTVDKAWDKAWKDDVRAWMKRQSISQADLARTLKVSPGSLTLLFKPDTKQSRLVPAIHRALGLTTPTTTRVDERDELRQRLEVIWRDLTQEQREILLSVGAQMRRKEQLTLDLESCGRKRRRRNKGLSSRPRASRRAGCETHKSGSVRAGGSATSPGYSTRSGRA
jgi:hypothetical protein